MTTLRGNVPIGRSAMFMLVIFAVAHLMIGSAGAQSSGCPNGPFEGATALDSDGDGVNDGDEVLAGTDECDPASTPTVAATVAAPPRLALTGPSHAVVTALVGSALLVLGMVSISVARRADA